MINIAAPIIEREEIDAVNRALESGVVAQGPVVSQLETDFARYCGTKYAVAVNSGTAALHCAMHAAGIGPGDEVITTPFSFIATVNPIIMAGAVPVLVDIKADDFAVNPELIEGAITDKTKVIVAVDLYGQPYDYSEVAKLAERHELSLIEDACQAIGATYGQKRAGSLGSIGCFSLYATKNIMSAEGGIVTTDNEAVAVAVKRFRQHGMVAPYEYAELGYNYRMTDILAAIGVEQLKKADALTDLRRRNAAIFDEGLTGIKGIKVPKVMPGRSHVYHQYTLRITADFPLRREELMAELKEQGIGTAIYYPKALHAYPHIAKYGYKDGDFPVAEAAAREVLALPVHPRVTENEAHKIVAAIRGLAHV